MALERYGRAASPFCGLTHAGSALLNADAVDGPRRRSWLSPAAPCRSHSVSCCPRTYLVHEVIARGLLVGFDTSLIRHTITTVTARRDRHGYLRRHRFRRGDRGAHGARPPRRHLPRDRGARLRRARHRAGARPSGAACRHRRSHQRRDAQCRRRRRRPCGRGLGRRARDRLCRCAFLRSQPARRKPDFARISTHIDDVARTLGADLSASRARSICRWRGRRSRARRCSSSSIA